MGGGGGAGFFLVFFFWGGGGAGGRGLVGFEPFLKLCFNYEYRIRLYAFGI